MPAGNDPTPLAELEQSFGVTSSAEELIRANQNRMTDEQLAGGLKEVNEPLNEHVQANLDKLEDHVGHEVVDARVRGKGSSALIHYTYVGPRDAHEKGYVPFADVFGSDLLKQRRASLEQSRITPDDAAQAAVDQVVAKAESDAQSKLTDAKTEAERILADAKAKAEELTQNAVREADETRAAVAEEARKAAEDARAEAERKQADADDAPTPKPKAAAKPKPAAT